MGKQRLILLFFCISTSLLAQDLDSFFAKSNDFFANTVVGNKVDYKKIKEDSQSLQSLVDFIAAADVRSFEQNKQKAFYINSYNLLVIHTVVQHYPIVRPQDVAGFFDGIRHQVAGKKMTLNDLEQRELLRAFGDARLHFVLVCAAVSCPSIANFAYTPDKLEEQLTARCHVAINDSTFIRVEDFSGEIELSKIFDWYATDFKPSVRDFINQYRTVALGANNKLHYYPYDWTLNDSNIKEVDSTNSHPKKTFAPILVAVTMPKNAFEVNLFNSLFTANYEYNNSRSTYFTGLFQFSYGVNGWIDVGLDFMLKSFKANDQYESSPFRALEFKRGAELVRSSDSLSASADFGLSHVGPRFRIAPFKKIALTLEQGFFFPIPSIPVGQNFDNAFYWVTQLYFNHEFNRKFGGFVALTFWQPIVPNQNFRFQVPYLKFFFSWYVSKRFTLYATTTTFTEWGAGAKFLITPQFELQVLYTYYVPIPALAELYVGPAQNVMTFNLGLRYRVILPSKKKAL